MAIQKDSPRSWLHLFFTVLLVLTVLSFDGSSGVFVAILIEKFNETNARAAWATSIVYFLELFLCPLVIQIYQIFGFHWCMAISGFLYVLTFLTSAFVPSLNYFFITFSIPFGVCLCFVAQLTNRTQRVHFDKFYGLALGIRYTFVAVGGLLMSFIFPVIYDYIGFKGAFLSLLSSAPIFFVYGVVSRTPGGNRRTHSSYNILNKLKIYQELCQDKSFTLCLAGTAVFYFTIFTPLFFMVRYGVTLGYPLSKAKWLLMIRNIASLPARLITGYLGGIAFRRGQIKLIIQCTYPVFGLLSFACSFFRSFPLLMVYMGLSGIVEAVVVVSISLYIDEITGGYHCDDAYSLLCFISGLTMLTGPPTMGWILDKTGEFRYVFYCVFVVSLLATFLLVLSSFVKVDKKYSLLEKSSRRKVTVESLDQLDATNDISIVYETSL